jgi:hypothetical protein
MPTDFSARRADAAFNLLQYDMLAEQAAALGHHARLVERSMAALHAFAPSGDPEARRPLVKAAAQAVWAYFVQREACGLRDHRQVIRDYAIPDEVLARLGAMD